MSVYDFVSGMPRVAWPGVPAPPQALALAVAEQLQQSQYWPAEALGRHQLAQAARLLDHARRTVPFYRDRLEGGAPDWARWRRLPVLAKSEIRAAGAALHSERLPPGHGQPVVVRTSGSTGTPMEFRQTLAADTVYRASLIRAFFWAAPDPHGRIARISSSPTEVPEHGQRSVGWGGAMAGLIESTAPTTTSHYGRATGELAAWLLREQPQYLFAVPNTVRALLRHFRRRGGRLTSLRHVLTYGETLPPDLREECRRDWGVRIFDYYGSTETGYLASQCPAGDDYHVGSESAIVEILDESGQPCEPGEVGRVVVTPLHNFAMPLIRYDLDDRAEVGGPCACGRGLPVLRRIVGRTLNLLALPGGERRPPPLLNRVMAGLDAVRRSQIVQTALDAVEVSLEVDRPLTPDEEDGLRARFREQLHHPMRVDIAYVDAIAPLPSGKYEWFRCRLGEPARTPP